MCPPHQPTMFGSYRDDDGGGVGGWIVAAAATAVLAIAAVEVVNAMKKKSQLHTN